MRENNDLILSGNYIIPSSHYKQDQQFKIPPWDPVEVDPDSSYRGIRHQAPYENFNDVYYEFELVANFIEGQFKRFNVPTPDHEGIQFIWETTLLLINHDDSYLTDLSFSDVEQWGDPQYYQYALFNKEDGTVQELDMKDVELFRFQPLDSETWHSLYETPGLDNIEYFYQDFLEEIYSDSFQDCSERSQFINYYEALKENPYDALHMGVWAAFLWTLSKEATDWRMQHPLIESCYVHGECLVVCGNLYSPDMYRKTNRPSNSCAFCFTRIPCVSKTLINLPRDHGLYRRYMFVPGNTEFRSVFVNDVTPGSYRVCNYCVSNLVYPVPHCLYTGCRKTLCPHHACQANKSRKLLV